MTSLSAQATSHRQPRSRRYVSPGTIRFVRFLGFRYSQSRDAYILRLVGGRFGPVQPTRMPVLAGLFLVVTLAALGLPGLNSFVGEFMTLLGACQRSPWLAVAGCLGLLFAPIYMLRLFQGVMYASRGEDPWPPGGHGPVGVARTDLARLAEPWAMSFAGASKHVKVLEAAGLLSRRKAGRTHVIRLEAKPLEEAARWLRQWEEFWTVRLDRLEAMIERDKTKKENSDG